MQVSIWNIAASLINSVVGNNNGADSDTTTVYASGKLIMAFVYTCVIKLTRALIRHPRPFILLPILTVFLLSYDAFYRTTLFHSTHWLQQTIQNFRTGQGPPSSQKFGSPKLEWDANIGFNITKVTFIVKNALSLDALTTLSTLEKSLPENAFMISPLTFLSPYWKSTLGSLEQIDKHAADKKLLKLFNYQVPSSVLKLVFRQWQKFNQIIVAARELTIYIFTDPTSAVALERNAFLQTSRTFITRNSAEAVNFLHYYDFLLENSPQVWLANFLARIVTLLILFLFALHLYISICNCHKIRSSIGLLIGWAVSIITAYFASLNMQKEASYTLLDLSIFGPARWQLNCICILCVMVVSSRTFYRTLHDLAGDNTFGEPESLHKRVIKYYLGINISEQNSAGIFWISQFVKSLFMKHKSNNIIPIPNVTIILLINLFGFSIVYWLFNLIMSQFLRGDMKSLYDGVIHDLFRVITGAIAIDHALQLTFIATIVIIDLNRVELSDILSRKKIEETTTYHEVNPISAFLFKGVGHEAPRCSLRHRIGTYFVQISPSSSVNFWMYTMPSICFSIMLITFVIIRLALPNGISCDLIQELVSRQNPTAGESDTYIYYLELAFIVFLIVFTCESCLSIKFAKKMNDDAAIALESEIAGDDQAVFFSQLLESKGSKQFECITLGESSGPDLIKLYSNSKCSHLISVDLDHRYLLWEPKKDTSLNFPIEIKPNFRFVGHGSTIVNHIEISDGGDYVILMNFQACRIKCFDTKTRDFTWEVSLTSDLTQPVKRMKTVATFFRKRTVVGFLARKLLSRKRNSSRRGSEVSVTSNYSWSGNYLPPVITDEFKEGSGENLHKEEFIAILETGEMIVSMCSNFKIQSFNLLEEAFQGHEDTAGLTIVSSKFLASARVSDKIVCNLSNNDIIVGTAIKNTWRFHRLELNKVFKPHTLATFAPPLMTRAAVPSAYDTERTLHGYSKSQSHDLNINQTSQDTSLHMNKSTIVTIEFVGMFVRVKELTAEMVDISTGTILRVFHIGSFKPGSFRVAHSEPTHCKFCGCASVESLTLLYEDLYEKTLILHTFKLQNAKSRNNICLRVERDPREVRCMGLDSAIESHYWYTHVEQWELTDMNVIIGIKKDTETSEHALKSIYDSEGEFQSMLRRRKRMFEANGNPTVHEVRWQGFVVTASNGKFLEYKIPGDSFTFSDLTRPNYIVKYGYKAVAVASGSLIKILYLGNDKLIENDLYYSGTTSSLNPILLPGVTGKTKSSDLLFINKRRGNRFRMPTSSFHGSVTNVSRISDD